MVSACGYRSQSSASPVGGAADDEAETDRGGGETAATGRRGTPGSGAIGADEGVCGSCPGGAWGD